ncbi:MAG: pre-peptidase C-terminal domain-containing protein [Pirellulales bacterium]
MAGCPPWDLGGGSVHDGSCTVNGSSDFTISGTAGQVLGARSAQERFPGLSGLTLTSPSQVVLSQTVSDDFATMVLPETGTYRVRVHAGSDPRNEFVGYGIEFLLRDLTGYGLRGGENFWTVGGGGAVDGALQADLRSVPTGHYQVQVQSGLGTILGHEFRGVSAQSSMSIVHVNGIDSPFGAGWGIAGWQQAYEQADGSVLIVDGDGSQLLFLPVATAAGQYQRPLGDFSNLQKNQGAFRRTLPDQTVYQFDVTGRLATVTDRQGNVTRYEYDGAGRLAAIVDPVGLSTHFAYSSGHLSTITDPANRVTRFSFDAEGNLTSVTDPDGATRTWRYDSLHHMIGETDQLGQEERTTYDFAGRAVQAVRKDGSVIQVDPLQTQFLLPPERTIDPLHAPPMFALTPPHALVASPNGNVRSLLLDRTGQAERSSDAEGNLGGAVYDPGTNLLLQSSNARGNTTDYSYDDRGNLLAVRDAEDAGDSLDSAKRVDVGMSASVRIHAAIGDSGFVTNDVDLYRVSLTAGDFLTATVEAFAKELSKLDSVLRIFDDRGNELARALRGLNPLDAGFKFRVPATGEYLVGVSSAANVGYDPTSPGSGSGGTTGGEYQLVLARNEAPLPTAILASDVPDQLDQARATVVASGSTTRLWGTIGDNSFQAADVDLFRVPLAAGDRLTIGRDVRVQNAIGAAVRLFDAAGNELVDVRYMDQARRFAEVDYDPTAVVYVVREAGDYYVGVSGRGNESYDPLTAGSGDAATVQGAYELLLSVNVAPAPNQLTAADVGGLLATALPVTLAPEATWVVSSEIGDGGTDESDVDLYALQLTQGDRLTIDFASIEEARSMVRGTLRLFDASGTLLGENTPYYGSPADLSLIAPTTGTYYLGVSSNGNGDYNPVTGGGLGSGTDRGPYLLRLATNVPRPNEYLLGNQGAEVGDVLASAHVVTFTSGQIFTALSAIGDSPAAADDVDLYRLELAAGDILTFGLDGAAVGLSEVDGPVRLFDSAGHEVNAAYDLVPGVDASFYVRQGGTYYLGVSGGIEDYDPATTVGRSGGFRTGPYVLVVGVNTEARPDRVLLNDVGDTFATADPLTLSRGATTVIGSTIGGTPAGRNDVDLYSLDLVKGDRVTIHVDSGSLGLSQISAYIRAFDPAGQPLWETPSGNNFRTVGLTFLARSSGRHTIGISAFGNNAYDPTVAGSGGNGAGEGDYRLTISRNVAPAADVMAAGSGAFGERRMTYDSQFNQPTSYTDEMGRTVTYTLDPIHGNVLVQRRIVGQDDSVAGGSDDAVTQFTYNARGQVLTRTDPLGHVTENRYDALGRLERVIYDVGGADEAHVDYAYDAAGNVVQRTDETGAVTVFEYDAHNRVTRMQEADPDGAGPLAAPVTTWTYDARGHTVGSTDAGGRTATAEYDELDRVVRQIDSANQATRYQYDVGGALTAIIDPLGLRTTLVYDTRQRLREVREPNGAVTRYRYDADNHRIELVDAAGNRTRFEYDARGRLVRETDPLLGVTEYVYNGANDLIGETDRNGRQRQYAFDDLGRMTSETWVGTGTVLQYGYDKLGNLLSASDANSQLTWTYTRRNFVDSADSQGPAGTPHVLLDYGHDAAGHVVSLADTLNGVAGGVEQSTYDALHRLVRVTQTVGGTGHRVDLAYNAAGQFTSLQRYQDLAGTQLAVSTNYTYDSAGRLASLGHTAGGQSAALYQFQYDAASRITQWTQDGTPQVLAYDANDQLLTVTPAGSAATERYTYDANGNRTGAGVGGTGTRSTGPANRLQSDGRYSYTYDADGNLIRRTELASGASTEYTWDFRNRLTAVTRRQADNTFVEQVEYRYDALDRRIRRTVQDSVNDATPEITHYVHDRDRVLLEMTGNGGGTEASRRYLHGPAVDQVLAQQDAGGGFEWLLADHVGTVRDVVEENGSTQSFAYDTFGRTTSPPAVDERRIGFAGHELDPVSGLYDFRARYYDAETGRFLSEDPLRWASGEENLYRYAANSPVLYVDPYGLEEAPPAQSAQFPTPVVVAQQAGNYYSNLPYAQQEQLKDAGVNAAQQTANTFFPGNDWFKPSDSKCKLGLNASGIGASYQTGNGTVTAGYNGDANVGYSTSNYSVGAGINPSTGAVTVGGTIPIGK